jgi:hypothetical protein
LLAAEEEGRDIFKYDRLTQKAHLKLKRVDEMRASVQLALGGFLVGLGLGWFISGTFIITYATFGWLLIISGAGIVVSALISWIRPRIPVGGLVVALLIGLILPIFASSGFEFEGSYRAEGTRTFDGSVTANAVTFIVRNRNGAVSVSTWDSSEYRIELTIRARGFTVGEAQRTIDDLDVDVTEERIQNQLRLVLEYNIPESTWRKLSIGITAYLPADAEVNLDLESSNGGIYLSGIQGDSVNLVTSNGPLVLEGVYANGITGFSSNGGIEGQIEASDTTLGTSNGGIEITIPCTASGSYDLSTSNGNVRLAVSSSDEVGYDLDLSTSNGNIDVDLSDLDYSLDERTSKKARTTDFAFHTIQITIETSTSNGSIDITV